MNIIVRFVKATVVGGLLFLVPIAILGLIFEKLLPIAQRAVAPVERHFPAHFFAGVAVGTVLAISALLLLSFLAGLIAKTSIGQNFMGWLENSIMGTFPRYRMIKSIAGDTVDLETGNKVRPVLVAVEGGWRIRPRL